MKNNSLSHKKIRSYVEDLIATRRLKAGDRLQPDRELAKLFKTSVRPVQVALNALVGQGVLTRVQGKGTFVNEALREKKPAYTDTVGIIYPHSREGFFASSFYGHILSGIESELAKQGRKFVIRSLAAPEFGGPGDIIESITGDVDGFIMIDLLPDLKDSVGRALAVSAKPAVLVNYEDDVPGVDRVATDNVEGVKALVSLLAEAGHTRIGYVYHQSHYQDILHPSIRIRLDAFREAAKERGVDAEGLERKVRTFFEKNNLLQQYDSIIRQNSSWHRHYTRTYQGFRDALQSLMKAKNRPTALVCCSDEDAYPLYVMAREMGLRIPDDLSLVGFDDLPESALTDPPLTTFRVPLFDMGVMAVRRLQESLSERTEGMRTRKTVLMPGTVVARGSHGPVRQ